jgi:hypothetical protein
VTPRPFADSYFSAVDDMSTTLSSGGVSGWAHGYSIRCARQVTVN